MIWNADQRERIAHLIGEGMSAAQIGRIFHVTRNAIIGVCSRRGIALNGSTLGGRPREPGNNATKRTRFSRPDYLESIPPMPVVYTPPPEAPTPLLGDDGQPFTLLTAKSGMCRFMPVDGEMTICGHPSGLESWCAYHKGIVFTRSGGPGSRSRDGRAA